MTAETVADRRNRRYTHKPNGSAHDDAERCPWCSAPISRDEFDRIANRIAEQERARVAKIERALKDRFQREQQQAQAKAKTEIDKAKKDAAAAAAAQVKALEEAITQRLAAQREKLEKGAASAVLAERAKHLGEKLKLEEQLQVMQRRLQARPAHLIGEPAEVDLYDALVRACPNDRVSRIVRGVKGPDVLIEVLHGGEVAGKICLDSKSHSKWSNRFTRKLRTDQLAENADYGILVSRTFPNGTRELHVQDNVIISSPERVTVLVSILRRIIVDSFVQKLGSEARNEKAEELFSFVLSRRCDDLFDKLLRLSRDLEGLDAIEAKSHQSVWSKRSELIQGVIDVHDVFCSTVANVIGGGR